MKHVIYLLDESGSMEKVYDAVISAFNEFVADFKGSDTLITLYTFDGVFGTGELRLKRQEATADNFPPLNKKTYVPDGGTPLYGAIGTVIDELGSRYREMKVVPDEIYLVINTDGEHNINGEYSKNKVAEMIKHQQEKYSWDIQFHGANINVDEYADQLNISNRLSYESTNESVTTTFRAASKYING